MYIELHNPYLTGYPTVAVQTILAMAVKHIETILIHIEESKMTKEQQYEEVREWLISQLVKYGHEYYDILNRMNESGDFTEANEQDSKAVDQILSDPRIRIVAEDQSLYRKEE